MNSNLPTTELKKKAARSRIASVRKWFEIFSDWLNAGHVMLCQMTVTSAWLNSPIANYTWNQDTFTTFCIDIKENSVTILLLYGP